jgi:hypothetical protein
MHRTCLYISHVYNITLPVTDKFQDRKLLLNVGAKGLARRPRSAFGLAARRGLAAIPAGGLDLVAQRVDMGSISRQSWQQPSPGAAARR